MEIIITTVVAQVITGQIPIPPGLISIGTIKEEAAARLRVIINPQEECMVTSIQQQTMHLATTPKAPLKAPKVEPTAMPPPPATPVPEAKQPKALVAAAKLPTMHSFQRLAATRSRMRTPLKNLPIPHLFTVFNSQSFKRKLLREQRPQLRWATMINQPAQECNPMVCRWKK